MFDCGQCATPTFLRANVAMSASSVHTQCAATTLSSRNPIDSRKPTGDVPYRSRIVRTSACVSATWMTTGAWCFLASVWASLRCSAETVYVAWGPTAGVINAWVFQRTRNFSAGAIASVHVLLSGAGKSISACESTPRKPALAVSSAIALSK